MRLVLILSIGFGLPHKSEAISITGLIQTSANSGGDASGGQIWNTLGGDGLYNLWVSTNINGGSPVNGPADANVGLNYALTPGAVTFYIYGSPGSPVAFNSLNIFFDGASLPGISVLGLLNTISFSANTSAHTLALDGSTQVPGAGTLVYTSGTTSVTLTGYSWNDPSTGTILPVGDFVAPLSFNADGGNDFRGYFTLNVATGVPEPSVLSLAAAGFALLAGMRLRRK